MLTAVLACAVLQGYSAKLEEGILTVRNHHTGAFVWSRRVNQGKPSWSPSGKALILLDRDWMLLYWREGEKVRKIVLQPPFKNGRGEPPGFDPVWAPNEQAVLLRVSGLQGDSELDIGTLMCFGVLKGQLRIVSDRSGPATWLDSERVSYDEKEPREVPEPMKVTRRVWKVRL